jgi:DNA-directed RNA polymerase specialized sigma24 family protein
MRDPTLGEVARAFEADPLLAGLWITRICRMIARLESRRLGVRASLTEDLAQEAALRIVRRLRSSNALPQHVPLAAWTRAVVARTASEWRRRSRRRPEVAWTGEPPCACSMDFNPATRAAAAEAARAAPCGVTLPASAARAWAQEALAGSTVNFDPVTRTLVALCAAGASHGQIAAQVGLSRNAVRLRIRRLSRESRDLPPPIGHRAG